MKLGFFFSCYMENKAVENSIAELRRHYPDLVPAHCINNMKCVTGETKSAQDYMLGKI